MTHRPPDFLLSRPGTLALIACLVSTGCAGPGATGSAASKPPSEASAVTTGQASNALRMSPQLSNSSTRGKVTATPRAKSGTAEAAVAPLKDTPTALFFTAGSAAISDEGRRLIHTLSAQLKENRRTTVTLIGHSDDTGSTEFDIAMAQRRVDAIAGEFQKAGVLSRQIRRISYGNEADKATACTTESCRQRERRVDLVIEG